MSEVRGIVWGDAADVEARPALFEGRVLRSADCGVEEPGWLPEAGQFWQ
jgi:hypothetical protein